MHAQRPKDHLAPVGSRLLSHAVLAIVCSIGQAAQGRTGLGEEQAEAREQAQVVDVT